MKTIANLNIRPTETILNGTILSTQNIIGLYREFVNDYPKFFKMDNLCKLGFIGAELLLKDIAAEKKENAAIILFNRSGSLVADRNYQKSIIADNYFPSPALFVYTLANIVTGEIAIRHKIYGESSFYILPRQDTAVIDNIVDAAFLTSRPDFVLTGWIEYESESDYIADLKLVTNNK